MWSIVGACLIALSVALLAGFWERQQRNQPFCGICGNTERKELVHTENGWRCQDAPNCLGVITDAQNTQTNSVQL